MPQTENVTTRAEPPLSLAHAQVSVKRHRPGWKIYQTHRGAVRRAHKSIHQGPIVAFRSPTPTRGILGIARSSDRIDIVFPVVGGSASRLRDGHPGMLVV